MNISNTGGLTFYSAPASGAGQAASSAGGWVVDATEADFQQVALEASLQHLVRLDIELLEFNRAKEAIAEGRGKAQADSLRKARKADLPIGEIRNYLRLHPNPTPSDSAWLNTKLQGRLAARLLLEILAARP